MKRKIVYCLIAFCSFLISCQPEIPKSTLITNVKIVDGSGRKAYEGSVRIEGDKIVEIGKLSGQKAEKLIDGEGRFLAPGFIDTHSHHDESIASRSASIPGIFMKKEVPEVVSQGITSIIIGQDGRSHFPLAEFWEKLDSSKVAVNIGSYVGHNTLRMEIMGTDYKRAASIEEVDKMKALLETELKEGALGLATGLEYDPGIYSDKSEVLNLASVLKKYNGRYISHMRSEDRKLEEAIDELLEIGKQNKIPVQISHFKLARVSLWQKAAQILNKLDSARAAGITVTADIYPYEYWQSTLSVLFPERDFNDLEAAKYALSELTTPDGVIISSFGPDPSYVGKTLAEVALLRNKMPEVVCLELIKEAEKAGSYCLVMAKSMHNDDIATIINWEHSNICSDGGLDDRHPRGIGSFPRVLSKYVKEEKRLSMEQAIQKMTALAALHMGIEERGMIQAGYYADLVLFDMKTIKDHASFENPAAVSEGILKVWVNGEMVWNNKPTSEFPGMKLMRK